jgi:hypothetical protein
MKKNQKAEQAYYRLRCKIMVLNKYGGECIHCHTKEAAILTIDHKNNDGGKDYKRVCSRKFYKELRDGILRDDLQVLCFNCQWRKRMYGDDFSLWTQKTILTTDGIASVGAVGRPCVETKDLNLAWLQTQTSITSSDYALLSNQTNRTANRHISMLIDIGVLEKVGNGPTTVYNVNADACQRVDGKLV